MASFMGPPYPGAAGAGGNSVHQVQVSQVLFSLRWKVMCQMLLALPVLGIFVCLITSLMFHSDHINNTVCKVYNFLPSISAVTGVSPQRYLWRVVVALHISPRLLVAFVSRAHYASLAAIVAPARRPAYHSLVNTAFYLNLVELATLCGVTYISNKENYPVHEKLFTLFMLVSLVYMLVVVRVFSCVKKGLTPAMRRSFTHKKCIFALKLAATAGLMFFFYRHRVYCLPKAFSWFSLCEYVIATCNMLYHVSVALDFSDHDLIVGQLVCSPQKQNSALATPGIGKSVPNDLSLVSTTTCNDVQGTPTSKGDSCSSLIDGVGPHAREFLPERDKPRQNSANEQDKFVRTTRKFGDVGSYEILNSSSESVSKLPDQSGMNANSGESPTASSEYAMSSSPITSSLSRSTSSFSTQSSSVGISESASLEAICSKQRREGGDGIHEKLLSDDEDFDNHCCSSNKKSGSSDNGDDCGRPIDRVHGYLRDSISDKSGIEGDIDSVCTSSSSSGAGMTSGSSDLSDDGSSPPSIRQILNTIPESSEGGSSLSSTPRRQAGKQHDTNRDDNDAAFTTSSSSTSTTTPMRQTSDDRCEASENANAFPTTSSSQVSQETCAVDSQINMHFEISQGTTSSKPTVSTTRIGEVTVDTESNTRLHHRHVTKSDDNFSTDDVEEGVKSDFNVTHNEATSSSFNFLNDSLMRKSTSIDNTQSVPSTAVPSGESGSVVSETRDNVFSGDRNNATSGTSDDRSDKAHSE